MKKSIIIMLALICIFSFSFIVFAMNETSTNQTKTGASNDQSANITKDVGQAQAIKCDNRLPTPEEIAKAKADIRKKQEEKKLEFKNRTTNYNDNITTNNNNNTELVANEQKRRQDKNLQIENDEKAGQILKQYYGRDIKVLTYNETDEYNTMGLIIEALKSNTLNSDETLVLKSYLNARYPYIVNNDTLKELTAHVLGY